MGWDGIMVAGWSALRFIHRRSLIFNLVWLHKVAIHSSIQSSTCPGVCLRLCVRSGNNITATTMLRACMHAWVHGQDLSTEDPKLTFAYSLMIGSQTSPDVTTLSLVFSWDPCSVSLTWDDSTHPAYHPTLEKKDAAASINTEFLLQVLTVEGNNNGNNSSSHDESVVLYHPQRIFVPRQQLMLSPMWLMVMCCQPPTTIVDMLLVQQQRSRSKPKCQWCYRTISPHLSPTSWQRKFDL